MLCSLTLTLAICLLLFDEEADKGNEEDNDCCGERMNGEELQEESDWKKLRYFEAVEEEDRFINRLFERAERAEEAARAFEEGMKEETAGRFEEANETE
ncbi:uncharacterized protein MONOS_8529 [Monocercomonoides exilis]|uniref:uncharacterized protein n=1 Tax=Monocercomonoides exilis TaxID=2049356 RepID=UPI003559C173|nr:hypothetical protein MONOS_8529 [Monocercomonoides exilis]|eukprot:MONOS_8529.1-p1 / transcript=MONOS_8529.1 / gene=MONOS_8529 / organism=Monocercomonoides_exilis_PA203 / gene_product=unspecified product / transcript_product=unspecified product / location=Mono_scaffold00324:24649-24945(+) / protein_length=99 / sequence_SO=supercontig / SO=protein_coding / is_pseudo=false